MRRPIAPAALAVLTLALSSGPTSAGAFEFPLHPNPTPGRYRGEDAGGRIVEFTFRQHPTRSISEFRIEHLILGDAKVLGPIWDSCNDEGNCMFGEWKLVCRARLLERASPPENHVRGQPGPLARREDGVPKDWIDVQVRAEVYFGWNL
jgi:hypothetical protein